MWYASRTPMPDEPAERRRNIRLVECWLPLAQEVNEALGWGDDAPALDLLIHTAAPALAGASSPQVARAILAVYHAVLRARRS